MANEITYDKAAGDYPAPFPLKMLFAANVVNLQYSLNQGTPAISKYVAYDTLVPPNPFIAVTQDGRGNVVYDGGFPKLYNTSTPAGTSAFNAAEPFVDAIRMRMTRDGTASPFHHERLSSKPVNIGPGDKLILSVYHSTAGVRTSIDATINGNVATRLNQRADLVDQNGLALAPATDTSAFSFNKWYRRTLSLTPLAGTTLSDWVLATVGNMTGVQTTWYKDIKVLDSTGAVKADLYSNTLEFPELTTATQGSQGFTAFSKKIVDVRDQLGPTSKYFFNCMRFVENKAKVAAGNRKVLILGDATAAMSYAVKSNGGNGFNTMLNWQMRIAEYIPTYKDVSDYPGGQLNTTLEEMEEYCCVLLMSSVYQNTGDATRITQACADAFVPYRENGNGVFVITDHGPAIPTMAQAIAPKIGAGFFATANRVVTGFGAWFSGEYNRTPVNVGFLRQTYGDHPLYATMEDSEAVSAGSSESRVIVNQFDILTPDQVPIIQMPKGRNVLQVAASLTDGSIVTFRHVFYVATHTVKFTDGVLSAGLGEVFDVGIKNQSLLNVTFNTDRGAYDAAGIVYKNGVKVGSISYTPAGGVVQTWDGAGLGAVKVNNGDEFSVGLTAPLAETTKITIKRFQPAIKGKRSLAEIMGLLRAWKPEINDIARMKDMIDNIATLVPWLGLRRVLSIPINLKLLGDYFNNEGTASQVLPNAATKEYTPTARPWLAAPSPIGHWIPPNPVTGEPIDIGYYVFSPVYGSERLPANFKMDYYTYFYFEAGTYRVLGQADDIFEFSIDGGRIVSAGARSQTDFTITESRFYALKVSNINTPVNTPGWWTCCIINMTTGAIVLRPQPGMWKTEEYTAS